MGFLNIQYNIMILFYFPAMKTIRLFKFTLGILVLLICVVLYEKLKAEKSVFQEDPHGLMSRDATHIHYRDREYKPNSGSRLRACQTLVQTYSNYSNWSRPTVPHVLQNVAQSSAALAQHICRKWLLPAFKAPQQLAEPERQHYSQRNQSNIVDGLLNQRRNGFYVEAGAADGEAFSNSLFFEKSRNWTGLLVEANPLFFKSILGKRRHAFMINSCISPTNTTILTPFRIAKFIGGLVNYMEDKHKLRIQEVFNETEMIYAQCFPLFSILNAMGVAHIDYFSLDVEGAELDILQTLPLDVITVSVFSIEYRIVGDNTATKKKLEAIKDLLVIKQGYKIDHQGTGDVIMTKLH